jgi:hypothetical protein
MSEIALTSLNRNTNEKVDAIRNANGIFSISGYC